MAGQQAEDFPFRQVIETGRAAGDLQFADHFVDDDPQTQGGQRQIMPPQAQDGKAGEEGRYASGAQREEDGQPERGVEGGSGHRGVEAPSP